MDIVLLFIVLSVVLGLTTAAIYAYLVLKISVEGGDDSTPLLDVEGGHKAGVTAKLVEISSAIEDGATAFLLREYLYIGVFMVVFAIVIGVALPVESWATAVSFIWGALTSIASGFIGMKIAVKANVRTTKQAMRGWSESFNAAFQGGAVMGFALVSLGLLNLVILIAIMDSWITDSVVHRYEAIAGYGLGGSTIGLFGRVGGGIYTKAADVGADLVGKVEENIPEDDPRNPGVIADNVGDNVGDIAGMGADLFGSFAEATCAALVVSANSSMSGDIKAMYFPLLVSSVGMIVCIVTSVIPSVYPVKTEEDVEKQLKLQLTVSTVLNTPMVFAITRFLPSSITMGNLQFTNTDVFVCIICGLWSGLLIGFVTEYYTSHSYAPVRDVSDSCRTGAATNIIYGLALGYKSAIIPVFALAVTAWASFHLANQYGVAMAALGMLSTLAVGLTIDGYGPISDNAGGIAEMAGLGPEVRSRTDALDAAGNTTAAIGKGFAIGSAALVSLALFSAYTVRAKIQVSEVSLLDPAVFAGLLVGAMLPYWFSAMTMKSVGTAALSMVEEVRRQFREIAGLREGNATPDYKKCVMISTDASLKEMILPGALVILSPLVFGYLFGKNALSGILIGALVSGVQMAISSSNTGGAWDNAKKYIEKGNLGGKGSDCHKAAVIGDTVGDPLKDTSGPALNILIKLMAILSLVFADFISQHGGIIHV